MNRIRYLAAGLLCLTGVIHVAQLVVAKLDASAIITVLFGVAYLVISFSCFGATRPRTTSGQSCPSSVLCLPQPACL